MTKSINRELLSPLSVLVCLLLAHLVIARPALSQGLTSAVVLESIELGQRYLASQQLQDGRFAGEGLGQYSVGVSALSTLAMLNSGLPTNHPNVAKGLKYLRTLPEREPKNNYEVALMIQVFAATGDKTDVPRIALWADRLEKAQVKLDRLSGGWSYHWENGGDTLGGHADPSNSQFAMLGLREAAVAGVKVDRRTWERAREYWIRGQNPDGGWSYSFAAAEDGRGGSSTGSMTVAGLSSLVIADEMLKSDAGVSPNGVPPCCDDQPTNEAIERALQWMSNHFAAGYNPGNEQSYVLYYLYGLERAGRLSGRRFFGDHDWYREGAESVLLRQRREGYWIGVGHGEDRNLAVATSYALLFLSKGLAPVLMNKLKYGPRDAAVPREIVGNDWNRHEDDVRNLTNLIATLDRWPKLMISQELDLPRAAANGDLASFFQAPVLYLNGSTRPAFNEADLQLLRSYLEQGGFIFATASCQSAEFESGFKEALRAILPPGEGELKRLPADHPIYRSEFLLQPEGIELYGIDFGCRTSVVYCPEDLGCYWDYWTQFDPPDRNVQLKARIIRATKIGVNVIAYATGREPPNKLDAPTEDLTKTDLDRIERGLLQVAKLRHDGGWDSAPHALRNLLLALNETVGLAASPKQRNLLLGDPNLFQYPLLYMHGRQPFDFSERELELLRAHLDRGGLLFADACCGSAEFDKSFREFATKLFPKNPMKQIPVNHELFNGSLGHDLSRVRRRSPSGFDPNAPIDSQIREVDPFLEGVEVDGRYVLVYSKYDISCALERQTALSCEGYIPEDAVRIAMNVVLYGMLKELRLPELDSK